MTAEAENVTEIDAFTPIATLSESDRQDVIEPLQEAKQAIAHVLPEVVLAKNVDGEHTLADAYLYIAQALDNIGAKIKWHERQQVTVDDLY